MSKKYNLIKRLYDGDFSVLEKVIKEEPRLPEMVSSELWDSIRNIIMQNPSMLHLAPQGDNNYDNPYYRIAFDAVSANPSVINDIPENMRDISIRLRAISKDREVINKLYKPSEFEYLFNAALHQ